MGRIELGEFVVFRNINGVETRILRLPMESINCVIFFLHCRQKSDYCVPAVIIAILPCIKGPGRGSGCTFGLPLISS